MKIEGFALIEPIGGKVAQTGRPTLMKRQMEAKRRQKREQKEERRAMRKAEKKVRDEGKELDSSEVDPDIADIVPGPQPPRF